MINSKVLMPGISTNGNIKIGKKGELKNSKSGGTYRQPERQPFFTITTLEKDASDNFITDEKIMSLLKALGKDTQNPRRTYLDKDGNIIGIPIRLLHDDVDLIFPTRLASYSGQQCVCSGNGEKASRLNVSTKERRDIDCPCERFTNPNYKEKDKCKANGALSCMIEGAEFFGVCHKFRTTSKNSVKSILGSLALISSITGGRLAAIPLHLIMSPKSVVDPDGKPQKIHVVSIVFNGFADQIQKEALRLRQDNVNYIKSVKMLESHALSVSDPFEEGEKDFSEEFYPESEDKQEMPATNNSEQKALNPSFPKTQDTDANINMWGFDNIEDFEQKHPEIFNAVKELYFGEVPTAPAKRKLFAQQLKEKLAEASAQSDVAPASTETPAAEADTMTETEARQIIADYPEAIRFDAISELFPNITDKTQTPQRLENIIKLATRMKEMKAGQRDPGMEG